MLKDWLRGSVYLVIFTLLSCPVFCSSGPEFKGGLVFQAILYTGLGIFILAFGLVNIVMCLPCQCVCFRPLFDLIGCNGKRKGKSSLRKLDRCGEELCRIFGICCEDNEEKSENNEVSVGKKKSRIQDSLLKKKKSSKSKINSTPRLSKTPISTESEIEEHLERKVKVREEKRKKKELRYCRTYINWILLTFLFLVIPYEAIILFNEFNDLKTPFTCPSNHQTTRFFTRTHPSAIGHTFDSIVNEFNKNKYKEDVPIIFGIAYFLKSLQNEDHQELTREDFPVDFVCDSFSSELNSTNVVTFIKRQTVGLVVCFFRSLIELFVVMGAVLAFRKPIMKVLTICANLGCTLAMAQWFGEIFVIIIAFIVGVLFFAAQTVEIVYDTTIFPNMIFTIWIILLEVIVVWRTGLCHSLTRITCTPRWFSHLISEPFIKLYYLATQEAPKFYRNFGFTFGFWISFFLIQLYVIPRILVWGITPYFLPDYGIVVPIISQVITFFDVIALFALYASCSCGICLRRVWSSEDFRMRNRFSDVFSPLSINIKENEALDSEEETEDEDSDFSTSSEETDEENEKNEELEEIQGEEIREEDGEYSTDVVEDEIQANYTY